MTLFQVVISLTLLWAVTGFPSPKSISDPDFVGSARTGKNWLTPYVSLLSSVIPPDETASGRVDWPTRDPRSSDSSKKTKLPKPAVLQQRPSFCSSVVLKHPGKKISLIRPTSGNIYNNKSHGDPVQYAAQSAARAAVLAHSIVRHDGTLISISNPRIRGLPQPYNIPRRLDVCSAMWPAKPSQHPRTEVDELFEYFSTYEVPPETPKSTTPMPPGGPAVEAVVAECNLPQPYQNDRYDWLEILAIHGGLPGCVDAIQQAAPEMPAHVLNDTCERPLPDNFTGEVLYTYMQSDLNHFYRYENAKLRFPGKPNQFLDVRGLLVWTSPPDDGNVYVVEYFYDDSGFWLYLPDHTCKFVDTATLTCTSRQVCWCQDGKETCLAVQGLPGNLLATLVGGG